MLGDFGGRGEADHPAMIARSGQLRLLLVEKHYLR